MTTQVRRLRRRALNDRPIVPDRAYVLYRMTAHRRLGWSHALQLAVGAARSLGRPLVVFEALRADYPSSGKSGS